MLDIKYIKENPQEVIDRLAMKGKDAHEDITQIIALDSKRREIIAQTEQIKADNPDIPAYEEYDELLAAIKKAMK